MSKPSRIVATALTFFCVAYGVQTRMPLEMNARKASLRMSKGMQSGRPTRELVGVTKRLFRRRRRMKLT